MRRLLIAISILLNINTLAQTVISPGNNFYKNNIYISGEWFGGLLSSSLHYERTLLSSDIRLVRFLNARLSYGRWIAAPAGGSSYCFALNTLSGNRAHHLEALLGMVALFDNYDYKYKPQDFSGEASRLDYIIILPQVSIGYRYQNPNGRLVFRIGLGIPYLQVGFGIAF